MRNDLDFGITISSRRRFVAAREADPDQIKSFRRNVRQAGPGSMIISVKDTFQRAG
jgi:hypothetical protein